MQWSPPSAIIPDDKIISGDTIPCIQESSFCLPGIPQASRMPPLKSYCWEWITNSDNNNPCRKQNNNKGHMFHPRPMHNHPLVGEPKKDQTMRMLQVELTCLNSVKLLSPAHPVSVVGRRVMEQIQHGPCQLDEWLLVPRIIRNDWGVGWDVWPVLVVQK